MNAFPVENTSAFGLKAPVCSLEIESTRLILWRFPLPEQQLVRRLRYSQNQVCRQAIVGTQPRDRPRKKYQESGCNPPVRFSQTLPQYSTQSKQLHVAVEKSVRIALEPGKLPSTCKMDNTNASANSNARSFL